MVKKSRPLTLSWPYHLIRYLSKYWFPLFEQVLVIGENKPFLSVIITLEHNAWVKEMNAQSFDINDSELLNSKLVKRFVLDRIAETLTGFPGYTTVRAVTLQNKLWTIEDETLKYNKSFLKLSLVHQTVKICVLFATWV